VTTCDTCELNSNYSTFMCCQRLPSRDDRGYDVKQLCEKKLAPAVHKPSNCACIVTAKVIFACPQSASPCLLAQHLTMCWSCCLVPVPDITRLRVSASYAYCAITANAGMQQVQWHSVHRRQNTAQSTQPLAYQSCWTNNSLWEIAPLLRRMH